MNLHHAATLVQSVLAIAFSTSLPVAVAYATTGPTINAALASCVWAFALGAALQFAGYPQMACACFALALVQLSLWLYLRRELPRVMAAGDAALAEAASRASHGPLASDDLPALKVDAETLPQVVDFIRESRYMMDNLLLVSTRIRDYFGFPRVVMSFADEPSPHILVTVTVQHCQRCDECFEVRRNRLLGWWEGHPLAATGELKIKVREVEAVEGVPSAID
jgi:hypothetical protein